MFFMRLLISFVLFSLLSYTGFAQSPTMQQKLYYTCKVWGFVKYYHSNVSTCHVNWDSVLLHTLPLVRSATTNNQFNDALDTMLAAAGPMALSSTYFPDTLSTELKRNRDWNWIDSSSFRSDVKTILDTIRNNFRPHAECWVINNPYTTSYAGWLVFPYDSLGLNTTIAFPNQDTLLLMLYKYWNIIRYFNPYNYVLDTPWDTTLYNYVVPIANSTNANSLYLLYMKIATTLNDNHAFLLTINNNYQELPGFFQPYLRLKFMGGQYVVIKSMVTGIYPGDAIISIDGLSPTQWEDSLRLYYSAGNSSTFRKIMCENMLGRLVYGTSETLVVQDSTGTNHTYIASCINPNSNTTFFYNWYYPADSLGSFSWTTMPCDIGYVNMSNLQGSDVNTMYNNLQNKNAIIFDLRNYPNATAWNIADLIYPYFMEYAKFTEPDVSYPGTYNWFHNFQGVTGNPTPYTGKVIILMDEITLSQAEYSCMILCAMSGAIKVGSQTSGADGNITYWKPSQDYQFGFTTLGVFYPNGDSTQRIGIVPDSVVYPTKAGIRHHRDEVLEKALSIAGCNLFTNNKALSPETIEVFPNPANDLLTVNANNLNGQEITINITDITGRTLMQKRIENNNRNFSVTFDIKILATGLYFVNVTANEQRYVTKIVKE